MTDQQSLDDSPMLAVVVTYNSARVIEGCLLSLQDAMTLAAREQGRSGEIVVVDNGSTDETARLVDGFPEVRLVRSTNTGYAGGINRGVAASALRGPILILNADLRLHPGAIQAMCAALTPGVGVVAPLVRNEDCSLHQSLRRDPTIARAMGLSFTGSPRLSEYVTETEAYESGHDVDWALGAALLISRECHDSLGGWDESFFLYSEETDFCRRARLAGFRVWFEPKAEVTHIGGDSGRSDTTAAMQAVNRLRLYRRSHSAPATAVFLALEVLSEATWVLRGHRESRASIAALLRPSRRPEQLNAGDRLLAR